MKIPLTHFDETINFTDLSYIEFPYSADAGAFDIDSPFNTYQQQIYRRFLNDDVCDYLLLRENTEISYTIENNIAHIYLNFNSVPADLREYALSLNIESDVNIVSVNAEFSSLVNYNTETGLVNISWSPNTMKSMAFTGVNDGLNGEKQDHMISIYPNPITQDPINIQFSDTKKGNYQIVLVDIFCKTQYEEILILPNGSQTIRLNISTYNLEKGIYFIKVFNEEYNYPVQKLEVL